MAEYNNRIVNVFAKERLAGNPLTVCEDARRTVSI
jgi:predicted PhzF superfamily epimerase YddE/YHI9